MKYEEKRMNQFLKGIIMGYQVFYLYHNYALDDELKDLFKEIIKLYKEHENNIINVMNELSSEVHAFNSLRQTMAVKCEKRKAKRAKDDFYLCIIAIEATGMGIVQGLTFLHKNKDLDGKFTKTAKNVVEDYDNIIVKIKDFLNKYQE